MMHASSAHEISALRESGPGSPHTTSPCADPRDIVRSRSSGCLKEKRTLFLDRAHMENDDTWLRSGPDSPASPLPDFSDVDETDFAESDCDFDSALPQDWPPLGTPASLYSEQIFETVDNDGRRGSLDPVSLIAALSRHAVLETPERKRAKSLTPVSLSQSPLDVGFSALEGAATLNFDAIASNQLPVKRGLSGNSLQSPVSVLNVEQGMKAASTQEGKISFATLCQSSNTELRHQFLHLVLEPRPSDNHIHVNIVVEEPEQSFQHS